LKPSRGDSKEPLEAWYSEAKASTWEKFADVKERYGSASSVGRDRVVFNIGGNKYRLVVKINYTAEIVYIRFIGTHSEYDRIDVSTI
jgi:mRNA interferase HigB